MTRTLKALSALLAYPDDDLKAVARDIGPAIEAEGLLGPAALAGLAPLVEDELVTVEENAIIATSRGRLLLRIIAMCFDRYLHRPSETPRFSRAI